MTALRTALKCPALLICVSAFAGNALTEGSNSSLHLHDALGIALAQHPSVLAQQRNLQGAEANLDGRKWQRYPNLTLDTSTSSQGSVGNTLRVQMPVWNAGRITADIDAAQSGIDAARFSIGEARLDIMARVIDAYVDISKQGQRLAASEDNIAEHERLKSMIARRVQSEINPAADLLLAQARLSQAKAERMQMQSQLATARTALAQLIGRQLRAIVPLADRGLAADEAALESAALAAYPEIKRMQAELQKAEYDIKSRRAALYPQVAARYENARNAFTGFSSSQVALVLVYESGGGLSALAGINEAEARREALRYQIEASQRKLVERIQTEYTNAGMQLSQVESYLALTRSTADVTESYARQFAVGRKTWIELLNAQREAVQARYGLIDANWAAQGAIYRLDMLAGGLEKLMEPVALTAGSRSQP